MEYGWWEKTFFLKINNFFSYVWTFNIFAVNETTAISIISDFLSTMSIIVRYTEW